MLVQVTENNNINRNTRKKQIGWLEDTGGFVSTHNSLFTLQECCADTKSATSLPAKVALEAVQCKLLATTSNY